VPRDIPVSVIRLPPSVRLAANAIPKSATLSAVFVEENVLRLDVAVDDPVAVSVVQSVAHFAGDPDRLGDRELLDPFEPVAEGLSVDEWHHVKHRTVDLA